MIVLKDERNSVIVLESVNEIVEVLRVVNSLDVVWNTKKYEDID